VKGQRSYTVPPPIMPAVTWEAPQAATVTPEERRAAITCRPRYALPDPGGPVRKTPTRAAQSFSKTRRASPQASTGIHKSFGRKAAGLVNPARLSQGDQKRRGRCKTARGVTSRRPTSFVSLADCHSPQVPPMDPAVAVGRTTDARWPV